MTSDAPVLVHPSDWPRIAQVGVPFGQKKVKQKRVLPLQDCKKRKNNSTKMNTNQFARAGFFLLNNLD